MKAIVYGKNGTTIPFSYREVNVPKPKENEVLIEVHAVSLNANDYRLFRMGLGVPKSKIFGNAFAGTIAAVGKSVKSFRVGDSVVADTSDAGFGGMAEFAVAPESAVVKKPAGVSDVDASAVPIAALTALQAFRTAGGVKAGQTVLVHGASGGVGLYAVQLAKASGAIVTAVCSTKNLDMARSLGADAVIDYTREDVTRTGQQFDHIVAVNGYHPLSAYKRILAPHGTYVMVGGTFPQIFQALLLGPLFSTGTKKMCALMAKTNARDLAYLLQLVANGGLQPVIDRQYPLREGAAAFMYVESGHARGKVVIKVKTDKENSVCPVITSRGETESVVDDT